MKNMNTINQFASTVSKYIDLVDGIGKHTKYSFLKECARILPLIYAQALTLPEPTEIKEKGIVVPEDKLKSVMDSIHSLLGDNDPYREVFDPLVNEEPLITLISDDLTDIYHDLKEGLLKWKIGTPDGINEALWDWNFSFKHHFGNHLVDVLRPIHYLITGQLYENEGCAEIGSPKHVKIVLNI